MSLLNPQNDRKTYWRSLDELADKPAFQDWMSREFPTAASELPEGLSRRRWLQLMGASLALGGLAGCRWEAEQFAPFAMRPQNRTPGEKQYFSTMWELSGVARPLTVTCIDGRPIKVEGNKEHPASRGASSAFDQALILDLYDPDRCTSLVEQTPRQTFDRSWEDFERQLQDRLQRHRKQRGAGLALLVEQTSSPARLQLLRRFLNKYPAAKLFARTEPTATSVAAGRLRYDLAAARTIVCFDADPFGGTVDELRAIRDWSGRRDPDGGWMSRLYCFESHLSLTGSNADHRVPTRSCDIPALITQLEAALDASAGRSELTPPDQPAVLDAVVQELLQHPGESVILVGEQQSPAVHLAARRINERLQNVGRTVHWLPQPFPATDDVATLAKEITAGQVQSLIILDGNPACGAAASAALAQALSQVEFSVYAGTHRDETARLCRWHVPLAHALESWTAGRTADGRLTLGQPMIAPLFDGRSVAEILALLAGDPARGDALIRQSLTAVDRRFSDSKFWRRAVHDGFVVDQEPETAASRWPDAVAVSALPASSDTDVEVVVSYSPATHDGRFANNGWLQETPDAVSKLTWDNAATMSPATAAKLNVKHGDVVRITAERGSVELPVFELPGVAADSIQLTLGYGRTAAGHVGGLVDDDVAPVGVDVSVLLPADGSRVLTDVRLESTGKTHKLATTQDHFAIDTVGLEAIGARVGELVRTGTLAEYEQHADFAQHRGPHHPPLESLWEEKEYDGHAWGMAIDLNRCIGCNACMVGCQSENNVPIVGKEQVLDGREMHWLRIDRYFAGEPDDPEVAHQPLACHHCENAPCEQVCPVAATVHSDEGLNDMVYNRCIGTRYCANNCPYKVRRFNFFDYNAPLVEPGKELVQLSINPDVTVRSRGVMEKCTYCVQRIQDTKIDAKNGQRSIEDGEIQTACQQACPAEAIVFGDLNDGNSKVAQLHADNRAYGMLAELNTKPRTMYLARIRNPHPWLDNTPEHDGHSSHAAHADDAAGHAEHEGAH